MNIPSRLAEAFPPSATALLDFTRRLIDDELLREIAVADYGCDAAEHFARLLPIRDHGDVANLGSWTPHEVLQLMTYSQPEDPTWKPGLTGLDGHRIRAFCCAALLRAEFLEEETNSSMDVCLAQVIKSCQALGEDAQLAAACFLTWATPRIALWNRWFFGAGLLILTCQISGDLELVHDTVNLTSKIRGDIQSERYDWPPDSFSQDQGYWNSIVDDLRRYAEELEPLEFRGQIAEIIQILHRPEPISE
jgi:hypothetical protein